MENKPRCGWVPLNKPAYLKYHDEEWGVPVYDDTKMFEFLVLESFQSGLSWEIVLNKRENFRLRKGCLMIHPILRCHENRFSLEHSFFLHGFDLQYVLPCTQ